MTALENLALEIAAVLEDALESDLHLDLNDEEDTKRFWALSSSISAAVAAFLTSDEAVDRAITAWWLSNPVEGPGAQGAAMRAAILAACGVESLPLDPVSEAELICGDYPAPCNHDPAHKKGAE